MARTSQPARLGEGGGDLIKDTSNHNQTGGWHAIAIIEAAIFTTLTDTTYSLCGTLISITIPAGMIISGHFTSLTMSSGALWAYRL